MEIFTVDAFTRDIFKGNPAAICIAFRDLPQSDKLDGIFQKIAKEMNLSETAFITAPKDSSSPTRFFLQWFTPTNEVDLCGHATLATAHILFERFLNKPLAAEIVFETKRAGELRVQRCDEEGRLQLDFPMGNPQPLIIDDQTIAEIRSKLNLTQSILAIQLCKKTKKLLLHLSSVDDDIKPQETLTQIQFDQAIQPFIRGIIVTGPSVSSDFSSRYFAPWNGILEDPVTGSAHTVLAVYWSRIFNRNKLVGHQKSERGGYVECELDDKNQRVFLRGSAITVMQAQIQVTRDTLLNLAD